jgi:hypothetical protein
MVKIAEGGFLGRGVSRPEHKNLAALLSAVQAVQHGGLEVKRGAGQVWLALIDKITSRGAREPSLIFTTMTVAAFWP